MKIYITSIFVDDQTKALDFYTNILGFVKKDDIPLGEYRWLISVIAQCDPERRITLRSVQGGVTADYTYELHAADGDTTRITLVADCRSQRFFWQMIGPLLRMAIKRVDGDQLANLKKHIEATEH